jgi:hypothetical protein
MHVILFIGFTPFALSLVYFAEQRNIAGRPLVNRFGPLEGKLTTYTSVKLVFGNAV